MALPKNKSDARLIEDEMSPYPFVANPATLVNEAVDIMEKNGIRHLPVVERGKITGIVSDRDLKHAIMLCESMQLVVKDFMVPKPYCVKIGTPLVEVVREMAKHKFGSVVILNARDRVIGIFTNVDALKLLEKILDSPEPMAAKTTRLEKIEKFLDSGYLI